MSDLHLEFQDNCRFVRDYDFPVTGEILVLTGDTMYLKVVFHRVCPESVPR